MISSQSRIVVSRWAMIRQVQPRRRRLSSTIVSVLGSSALVASSRIKQAGVAHQGPGDLQPLALAAGEVPPLLGDGRAVAAPPLQQVAVDRRVEPGLDQPVRSGSVSSQRVRLSRTVPSNRQISASTSATELTKTSRGSRRAACRRRGSRRSRAGRAPPARRPIVDLPLPELPTRAMRWPGRATSEKSLISGSSTVRL